VGISGTDGDISITCLRGRGEVMKKIGLFGAAGAIGQSIAAALAAQRQPYRVVGRSREALSSTFGNDPSRGEA
jgi:predicted amino acid dehydrogenase